MPSAPVFPPKNIAVLGSTGSIGVQTLEVVDQFPDLFRPTLLVANKSADALIAQALKYRPKRVAIADESQYNAVKTALEGKNIDVLSGAAAIADAVTAEEIDVVLTAMVGFAGLAPTIRAIEAGKDIALANKETLVVAGELISKLAAEKGVKLLPVDSEHSAIFQCLVGEDPATIHKICLTASGGPFRGFGAEQLRQVTLGQALKHPNWNMGAKITIDSATMMNKGLEVIEAKWLFGVKNDQIDIVVHPQSIIHSLVEFNDGSLKAQMGLPDMKLPIQYALAYPQRLPNNFPRFSFAQYPQLTFETVDRTVFRSVALAYQALEACGNLPCILNAANEIAVDAFLSERIGFTDIYHLIELAMGGMDHVGSPDLQTLFETDSETRAYIRSNLRAFN